MTLRDFLDEVSDGQFISLKLVNMDLELTIHLENTE